MNRFNESEVSICVRKTKRLKFLRLYMLLVIRYQATRSTTRSSMVPTPVANRTPMQEQIAEKRRAIAALSSDLSLAHDVTVSIQIVPLAQFHRYADFLPFYQNVLKEGIRYAS